MPEPIYDGTRNRMGFPCVMVEAHSARVTFVTVHFIVGDDGNPMEVMRSCPLHRADARDMDLPEELEEEVVEVARKHLHGHGGALMKVPRYQDPEV